MNVRRLTRVRMRITLLAWRAPLPLSKNWLLTRSTSQNPTIFFYTVSHPLKVLSNTKTHLNYWANSTSFWDSLRRRSSSPRDWSQWRATCNSTQGVYSYLAEILGTIEERHRIVRNMIYIDWLFNKMGNLCSIINEEP